MTIQIESSAFISLLCLLEDSVRGSSIRIGARTVIDAFVRIIPTGGMGDIVIGDDCYINSGTVLYGGHGIVIGDEVLVAANVVIAPTGHAYKDKSPSIKSQGHLPSKGGVVIGDDVWIGALSAILDGSVIGDGCVVGASSLVRSRLEPYGVYAGNPLQKISTRS